MYNETISNLSKKNHDYDTGLTPRIPIGTVVYEAGDFASWTEKLVVDKSNQKIISMFWNRLYFDDEKKADFQTNRAHTEYSEYQADCAEGYCHC